MILACIDGSNHAVSVCQHAAWAATTLDVPVELLHILERPRMDPVIADDRSGRLGIDTREHLLEQIVELDEQRNRLAQETGRLLLDEAAREVRAQGVTEIRQRLAHGELGDQLHHFDHAATMVVIGKEGEGEAARRQQVGANLERLIRTSSRPVLVAPQAFRPVNRYLFAFDGGASTGRAIDYLVHHPLLSNAVGRILLVGDAVDSLEHRLHDAASRLSASGMRVSTMQRSGNPDDVIPATVEELDADLLIMGAYGHSRIREWFVGSTTTTLLRTTTVPLLVVR